MSSAPLWHYTCRHAGRQIGYFGPLRPNRCPWFLPSAPPVVWLTDLPEPDADGLGLTSRFVRCDRTARRYTVLEPDAAVPWSEVRDTFADPAWLTDVETFGRPEHWFVATGPVRVKLAVQR